MRRIRFRVVLAVVGLIVVGLIALTSIRSPIIFGLRDDIARAIPNQRVPDGVDSLSAESCAVCHRAIYEEWRSSVHAAAYTDPFFQAYWQKDRHIWVCLNCHTPLQNQQPELVLGLEGGRVDRPVTSPNPDFDDDLRHEGVTCSVCHVRDGVILGPYDDSVAPHPTAYDPRYRSTDICYTCHAVPSDRLQFYNGGPCATFMEFEQGPYRAQGYICQDCHMPEVERVMAEGGPVRMGRRHLWRGGHDQEQLQRAMTATLLADRPTLRAGQRTIWTLRVTNSGAGHMLPTGDPDRYLLAQLEVRDRSGRVIASERATIRRWIVWWPVIYEYRDTRIPPLGSKEISLSSEISQEDDGYTVTASVSYHFMTDRQYRKLQTKYGLAVDKQYVIPLYEETVVLRDGETVRSLADATQATAECEARG